MLEIKHGGNEPLTIAVPLGIEPLTFEQLNNTDNYCEASVSWELALKAQMSEFGLNVETVAEGVLILIDTLKNHGIKIKLSDDRHNSGAWRVGG